MQKPTHLFWALLPVLCLGSSASAFALKPAETEEGAGLEQLDRTLRSAGLEEFRLMMQLSSSNPEENPPHNSMAFNPATQVLLLAHSEDPAEGDDYSPASDTFWIRAWARDIRTKEMVTIRKPLREALVAKKWGLRQIAFRPDGKTLYFHKAGRKGHPGPEKILAYDWSAGSQIGEEIAFDSNELAVEHLAGSPDGKTLFVLARQHIPGADPHAYRWVVLPYETQTGKVKTEEAVYFDIPESPRGTDAVDHLAGQLFGGVVTPRAHPHELLMEPSGERLFIKYIHEGIAAGSRGIEIRAYDLKTRQQAGPAIRVQTTEWINRDAHPKSTLALSPDGKILYMGVPENDDPFSDPIVVFDTQTGRSIRKMAIPGRISSLAISGDGRLLTAISTLVGGKEKERLTNVLSVFQADVLGEGVPQLSPAVPLLGPGVKEKVVEYPSIEEFLAASPAHLPSQALGYRRGFAAIKKAAGASGVVYFTHPTPEELRRIQKVIIYVDTEAQVNLVNGIVRDPRWVGFRIPEGVVFEARRYAEEDLPDQTAAIGIRTASQGPYANVPTLLYQNMDSLGRVVRRELEPPFLLELAFTSSLKGRAIPIVGGAVFLDDGYALFV